LKPLVKENSKFRGNKPVWTSQRANSKILTSNLPTRSARQSKKIVGQVSRRGTSWQRDSKPVADFPRNRPHPSSASQPAWLFGRREVIELLKSDIKAREILILRGGEGDTFDQILALVEARGIPLRLAERREFDNLFPGETHQGVAAAFTPKPPVHLDDLISANGPSLLVMLDGVSDPHNLGAVIRSAEVFGAAGIIIPERRAAGLTPAVIKTSAGAALRLPTAIAGNLAQAIKRLKESGFWIYGLDPEAAISLWEANFPERICIILGSEGHGLARLTRELCDELIAIPQSGQIGSLNISATAAVVMAELSRRREISGKKVDL